MTQPMDKPFFTSREVYSLFTEMFPGEGDDFEQLHGKDRAMLDKLTNLLCAKAQPLLTQLAEQEERIKYLEGLVTMQKAEIDATFRANTVLRMDMEHFDKCVDDNTRLQASRERLRVCLSRMGDASWITPSGSIPRSTTLADWELRGMAREALAIDEKEMKNGD